MAEESKRIDGRPPRVRIALPRQFSNPWQSLQIRIVREEKNRRLHHDLILGFLQHVEEDGQTLRTVHAPDEMHIEWPVHIHGVEHYIDLKLFIAEHLDEHW